MARRPAIYGDWEHDYRQRLAQYGQAVVRASAAARSQPPAGRSRGGGPGLIVKVVDASASRAPSMSAPAGDPAWRELTKPLATRAENRQLLGELLAQREFQAMTRHL